MNEQLTKKVKQYMETVGISSWQVFPSDMAKFAELIVLECIETMYDTEQITVAQFVDATLKQHFGVE